jgi:hypothetical protein
MRQRQPQSRKGYRREPDAPQRAGGKVGSPQAANDRNVPAQRAQAR